MKEVFLFKIITLIRKKLAKRETFLTQYFAQKCFVLEDWTYEINHENRIFFFKRFNDVDLNLIDDV